MTFSSAGRIGIVWIVVAVALAGCNTTPANKQAQAATDFADTKQRLIATSNKIDQTLESLNSLLRAPPAEIETAYADYAKDVDDMHDYESAIRRNVADLRASSRDWMSEWQAAQSDIDNPELRKVSAKRQAQVKSSLNKVEGSFREARVNFEPFMNDIDDVRKALANDRTAQGVANISRTEAVKRANVKGRAASRSMTAAAAEVDKLSAAIPPSTATK